MRKLVDRKTSYRVNGKEWIDDSFFRHIHYWDEENTEKWTSREMSFSDMCELVEMGFVPEAKVEYTIFNKRKLILPTGDLFFQNRTYRENSKIKFEVKQEYEPYNSSIKTLADLLPADEFCNYLKDKGISQISTF